MIASSCAKEEMFEPAPAAKPVGVVPMTFTATTEQTKAVLGDDLSFQWEVGDSISIWDGTNNNKFVATAVNGNSATFYGEAKDTTAYVAVYPYRESNGSVGYKFRADGTVAQANIPAKQTLANGKNLDSRALICVAVADAEKNLHFQNIGGLIKVTVTEPGVTSIVIKSCDNKMAGNFTFGLPTDEEPYPTITTKINAVLNLSLYPEGEAFEQGKSYYLVALPDTYGAGMMISMAKAGSQAFRETKKDLVINRSSGVDLGSKLFDGATWLSDEIMNKEQFLAFAKYSSYYPADKTITLGADIDLESQFFSTSVVENMKCSFDGKNHSIYNIFISGGTTNIGLFGNVTGNISNLVLGSSNGTSYDNVSEVFFTGAEAQMYNIAPIAQCSGNLTNIKSFVKVDVDDNNTTSSTRLAGLCAYYTGVDKTISNCVNYGEISNVGLAGSPAEHLLGGLICTIYAERFSILDCENRGDVVYGAVNDDITKTGTKRCSFIGGIVAATAFKDAEKDKKPRKCHIERCRNYGRVANISVAGPGIFNGDPQHVETIMGGIIGRAGSLSDGGEKANYYVDLENHGEVFASSNTVAMEAGIVGRCDQGNILQNCHNYGTVTFNAPTAGCRTLEIAGIVGKAWGVPISDCTNEAAIYTNKKYINHVGGIAGTLDYSVVSNCSNTATITDESNYVGTAASPEEQLAAGIVALAEKNETAITVSGCTNTGDIVMNIFCNYADPARNIGSGIVGAVNVNKISGGKGDGEITITNNTNSGNVTIENRAPKGICAAGILGADSYVPTDNKYGVAKADRNPVNMSGNENSGNLRIMTTHPTNLPIIHEIGGVVGRGSYVVSDGDKSFCAITNVVGNISETILPKTVHVGALFGYNANGEFTNGLIGGSVDGVTLTEDNFADYIGVCLNGTVEGTSVIASDPDYQDE